jgi:hypothetical protein
LANGGYIIRMRPAAIGTDVVPILRLSKTFLMPGSIAPRAMPAAIARKIQSVSNLSRKVSRRRGASEATVTLALIIGFSTVG